MQRELGRYGEATLPPSSTLPTSVLPGVPYEAHAGLVIFWDFAAGLSRQVSQCTPHPTPHPHPHPDRGLVLSRLGEEGGGLRWG